MLGAAAVVFAGTIGLLILGWVRRKEPGLPLLGSNERANSGLVLLFGMAIPVVAVSAVFVAANVLVLQETVPPDEDEAELTVEVTGHQWFWEVRYPGTGAFTANEIHIPVDTQVSVVALTDDVIHSFWVPELNRKVDMIPGRRNRVGLYAEEPGVFRGQCSEFCGIQHANMAFDVVATSEGEFERWLQDQAAPAQPPASPLERRGMWTFMSEGCASCHTIRGTQAQGSVGPDLTHVAGRETLAANTIPNRHGPLSAWVDDPQSLKPGVKMPGIALDEDELQAVVAYLSGLE